MPQKIYDLQLIKRLSAYFFKYWGIFLASFLLLILSALLLISDPYLTKIAIDTYILHEDYAGLSTIAIIYIALLVISLFVNSSRVYLMNLAGQKVVFDMRTQLFFHLIKMPVIYYDKNPVGKLVSKAVDDIEALNEMVTSGIVNIAGNAVHILGIVLIMCYLDINLSSLLLILFPILFYTTKIYRNKARIAYRKIRNHLATINTYLQENIAGMSTVQMFSREKRNFKIFSKMNQAFMKESMTNVTYNAVFFPVIDLYKTLAVVLILWYGGMGVIENSIQIGVLVAFIQYVNRLFMPIRDLAEKFDIFQSAMAALERVFYVLDSKTEPQSPDTVEPAPDVAGHIVFDRVWFSYNGDENYVLKDVSFDCKPGESLAIVGITGAGKTSIINVLNRFYDISRGTIYIDGIDIRKIDIPLLRKKIGTILQDIFMFSGTIAKNIALFDPSIPLTDIKKAAENVYADTFIDKLPGTYDFMLQENGGGLSLGQRQLIAFARTLVFNPPILILDEATSNIDSQTEYLVTKAFMKVKSGRTSIIIAHPLSAIRDVDKVLILEDGRCKEFGFKNDLLLKKGCFYELMQAQTQR